ncbi:hypothetical protein FNYG_05949 [Fusarium nygamai]|uniref:Uncharacterized protein n=1 Tax=Gibberella nygamai TaxID=42673 RepID=A0A2K0WDI9_GIBNY|nr:hypothetical protein FNYG_05949 [Fusarium nygamai]
MSANHYDRLDDQELASTGNALQKSGPNRAPSRFALLTVLVGTACTIFGYTMYPYIPILPQQHRQLHCGNSSVEAQHLGCVFDLLTNNWMPEYCSDNITDSEYREWVFDPTRKLGPWAFFLDREAQHRVKSEQDLSELVGVHVYTTTENHLAHCTFLARRMHRLTTGEIKAVAHNTFAHTRHCTSSILEAISGPGATGHESSIASTFDVGIVSCTV